VRKRTILGCLLVWAGGFALGDKGVVPLFGDASWAILGALTAAMTSISYFQRMAATDIAELLDLKGLEPHQLKTLNGRLESRRQLLEFRFYVLLGVGAATGILAAILKIESARLFWHVVAAMGFAFIAVQLFLGILILIDANAVQRFSRDLKTKLTEQTAKYDFRQKIHAPAKGHA